MRTRSPRMSVIQRNRREREQKKERQARIDATLPAEEDREVPLEALVPSKVRGGSQTPAPIRTARENLTKAFDLMGGVPKLVEWGLENKTEFYRIWARLVPKEAAEEPNTANLESLLSKLAERSENTVLQAATAIGAEALAQGRQSAEAEDAAAALAAFEGGETLQ